MLFERPRRAMIQRYWRATWTKSSAQMSRNFRLLEPWSVCFASLWNLIRDPLGASSAIILWRNCRTLNSGYILVRGYDRGITRMPRPETQAHVDSSNFQVSVNAQDTPQSVVMAPTCRNSSQNTYDSCKNVSQIFSFASRVSHSINATSFARRIRKLNVPASQQPRRIIASVNRSQRTIMMNMTRQYYVKIFHANRFPNFSYRWKIQRLQRATNAILREMRRLRVNANAASRDLRVLINAALFRAPFDRLRAPFSLPYEKNDAVPRHYQHVQDAPRCFGPEPTVALDAVSYPFLAISIERSPNQLPL